MPKTRSALSVCPALPMLAAMAALLGACGGAGLEYTIPDDTLSALSGDNAARVKASREEVGRVEARLDEHRKAREAAERAIVETETRKEKAEVDTEAAEDRLAAANDTLKRELERARLAKEQAIANANKEHDRAVAQAKATHGTVSKAATAELKAAGRATRIEETRLALEQAKKAQEEAEVEALDAAVWVARARYELTKLEEVAAANGQTGPAYDARRKVFQEQVDDRARTYREAEEEAESRRKDTAEAAAAHEAARNKG